MADDRPESLACLVLAAGRGSRMRPFTNRVPKPLLTVDNEPLLARSLRMAAAVTSDIAVNSSYLAAEIAAFLTAYSVQSSYEPEALGSAGAIGPLLPWLGDRDLLILNGDTWLETVPDYLVAGWDRVRPRLLVQDLGRPSDFGNCRFVGASLLPNRLCRSVPSEPSGLYEAIWRPLRSALDFVPLRGRAFDCGTPAEFLAANLYASGGRAVVHPTARPGGPITESVFLAGATSPEGYVAHRELRDAVDVIQVELSDLR